MGSHKSAVGLSASSSQLQAVRTQQSVLSSQQSAIMVEIITTATIATATIVTFATTRLVAGGVLAALSMAYEAAVGPFWGSEVVDWFEPGYKRTNYETGV